MESNEKSEKSIKEKPENAENTQKKSRSKKGMVKISPVTATLLSGFFMWHIGEFRESLQENDVTKMSEWVLSNPKIEEKDMFARLRDTVKMSSLMMSAADILEANLLQQDPESVILTMYYILRKLVEARGELNNKADVAEFNRKAFRELFNSYDKTPLFKKKYREIHRLKGNDDKHKYQWQRKTEGNVTAKFAKMNKKLSLRKEKIAPKLYLQAMDIIERFYEITLGMQINSK
jgi:hypothetical protein